MEIPLPFGLPVVSFGLPVVSYGLPVVSPFSLVKHVVTVASMMTAINMQYSFV